MRKCIALLLITCLVVSSLLVFTVTPVTAQAGYKPSVPQFTVKLIDNSYDIPPTTTTTTNPYTGEKTTITNPGYHVEKYDIEVTIKNQPFTYYTNTEGYDCALYYDVQKKAHFDEKWQSSSSYYPFTNIEQSSSKETIVTYTLSENGGFLTKPPLGGQLDFRVEAFIGYWRDPTPQESALGIREQILTREESSGWSSIQTITIPDEPTSSPSPSQTATLPPVTSDGNGQPQSPHQTQPPNSIFANPLFTLVIGVLLGGVVVATVLMILRRQPKTSTQTNTYTVSSQKLFSLSSTLLVRCEW
jgi:hypothetical protein